MVLNTQLQKKGLMYRMLGLILNEKKVADEIIVNNNMTETPYNCINILIKYYYLKDNSVTKLDLLYKILDNFDRCMGDNYKKSHWEDTITKKIDSFFKSIRKYGDENVKLSEVNKINITKEEVCRIKEVEDKKIQRVMFIMLVYSKVTNKLNSNDSYWFNQSITNIMKEARITNKDEKTSILYYLNSNGYITDNARIDRIGFRVNYAYEESESEMVITDFDECIHYWLMYIGEKWKRCIECGKWIKSNKNNNNTMCKECKVIKKMKQNKESYKKNKN